MARPGAAWLGAARRGKAREVADLVKNRPAPSAFPECVWPCGTAGRGKAGLGMVRLGKGSDERKADSMSRFCDARALTAVAWQGAAWHGRAWQGKGPEGHINEDYTMATLKLTLTGTTPLLMHSDRFSDPLDPMTKAHKALTSKRKKSDTDHEDIARSELLGAIYFSRASGIHLPGSNLKACLTEAAKLNKLGTEFKRSLLVLEDEITLRYDGPQDPQQLVDTPGFSLAKSVKVGTARVMRHRPRFPAGWQLVFHIEFDDTRLDRSELLTVLGNAGRYVGVGDWRPACGGTYGRFNVEVAG